MVDFWRFFMSKGQTLQDPFLNALRKDRIPVSVFLVNGIKLQGQIESFDQYVVLLKNTVSQMVYKHAISTIVPTRNPRTGDGATGGYQGGNVGSGYPMGGNFDRQSNFDRQGGFGNARQGGFRSPSSGNFDRQGGFDRGYNNTSYDHGGFGGGNFDRNVYEERGFDGNNFESSGSNFDISKGFDKGFDDDNNR